MRTVVNNPRLLRNVPTLPPVHIARSAFFPFGLGDTSCLGKSMAYHEASLVLAKTLWFFDFEVARGEDEKLGEGKEGGQYGRERKEEYQLFDVAVADHDGPVLKFVRRLRSEEPREAIRIEGIEGRIEWRIEGVRR